jgi:hypothetical protein
METYRWAAAAASTKFSPGPREKWFAYFQIIIYSIFKWNVIVATETLATTSSAVPVRKLRKPILAPVIKGILAFKYNI